MTETKKDVLRPTDDEAIRLAKTLLRTARFGALAFLDPATGAPSVSRIAVATDHDGTPITLISTLAAHTGGVLADPRCSLLVGEPGKGDPLAHPRMTIACRPEKVAADAPELQRVRWRFLSRNPKSRLYSGFADFSFFRLVPLKASLNGGFGKAYMLEAEQLLTSSPAIDAIAAMEPSVVEHMNKYQGGRRQPLCNALRQGFRAGVRLGNDRYRCRGIRPCRGREVCPHILRQAAAGGSRAPTRSGRDGRRGSRLSQCLAGTFPLVILAGFEVIVCSVTSTVALPFFVGATAPWQPMLLATAGK